PPRPPPSRQSHSRRDGVRFTVGSPLPLAPWRTRSPVVAEQGASLEQAGDQVLVRVGAADRTGCSTCIDLERGRLLLLAPATGKEQDGWQQDGRQRRHHAHGTPPPGFGRTRGK